MKNQGREVLNALLAVDPIAKAEQITGRRSPDKEVASLGFLLHMAKSEAMKDALTATDDTHHGISLSEYLRIVKSEGFEEALTIPFTVQDSHDTTARHETLYIMFLERDGVLLVFDTFHGNLNGGKFYYNWRPNEQNLIMLRPDVLSSGSFHEGIWAGDHDCREALRHKLNGLRLEGTFVTPWQKQPFLWLLHHGDTRNKDYDYQQINADRISRLPDEVRRAITESVGPCDRYFRVNV